MSLQDKIRDLLLTAGDAGCEIDFLARTLYGESDSGTRGRLSMLVGSLRNKGFDISTTATYRQGTRISRYILVPKE